MRKDQNVRFSGEKSLVKSYKIDIMDHIIIACILKRIEDTIEYVHSILSHVKTVNNPLYL